MNFRKYFSKDRFSLRQVAGMLTLAITGVSVLAYATTVPYTFTSGTTVKASEVNANFQALADAINNRTPATLANVAGTWPYTMSGSYIIANNVATPNYICTNSRTGTLTLNADGTFSDNQQNPTDYCQYIGLVTNSGNSILTGTWTVSADGSGTMMYSGITVPFKISRDLNMMNSVWQTTTGSHPGNSTATYFRQ